MPAVFTSQPRAGTHSMACRLENATDKFAVEPTNYDAEKARMPIWNLSTDSLKTEQLENQAARVRAGEFKTGRGLPYRSAVYSHDSYLRGVGDIDSSPGAGDGETPLRTAYDQAMAAVLGGEPTYHDGDTVSGAGSETSMTLATPAAFPDAMQAMGFVHSSTGRLVLRPGNYTSAGGFVPLMNFDTGNVPGDTNVVPGSIIVRSALDSFNQSMFAELIGKNSKQNYKVGGVVGDITWAEVAGADAQTVSWNWKVARIIDLFSATQTPPSQNRPVPNTGGGIYLAKFGNTSAIKLCNWNIGWSTGNDLRGNQCHHYQANDSNGLHDVGIDGWSPVPGGMSLSLLVREDEAVPAGFTETTWRGIFRSLSETENQWHCFIQAGDQHGATVTLYFPKLILKQPDPNQNVEDLSHIRLPFGLDGSATTTEAPSYVIHQQF